MTRAENLQDKLNAGMSMLFKNLPDDVAIFTYVYIRDKSDRSEEMDGKTVIDIWSKNCTTYDTYSVEKNIRDINTYPVD